MKLTITKLFLFLLLILVQESCGDLSSVQVLNVEMYGVSKAPSGAAGDQDPNFQVYQLLNVDILSEDGATTSNLFDGEVEKIFRVVDREQLIFSKKIDDLEGNTYSSIQLSFAPLIAGGLMDGDALSFTMSSPELTLVQSFAVEKAKDLNLIIKINWGNTIATDTMTEPEYELSLE